MCLWRERALPLALPAGWRAAPQTPCIDACRVINPLAHASGMPKTGSLLPALIAHHMRSRPSAYHSIESGFQGTKSSPGVTFCGGVRLPQNVPRSVPDLSPCRLIARIGMRGTAILLARSGTDPLTPVESAPAEGRSSCRGCRGRGRPLAAAPRRRPALDIVTLMYYNLAYTFAGNEYREFDVTETARAVRGSEYSQRSRPDHPLGLPAGLSIHRGRDLQEFVCQPSPCARLCGCSKSTAWSTRCVSRLHGQQPDVKRSRAVYVRAILESAVVDLRDDQTAA